MNNLKVRQILQNNAEGTRYRVIHILPDSVVLCRMDVTKLSVIEVPYTKLLDMVESGAASLVQPESGVFDIDKLSDSTREDYERKRDIMREVEDEYGPMFLRLMGKGPKPQLAEIMKKYDVSSYAMWKYIRQYLQGGLSMSSLRDGRTKSPNKGRSYSYKKKTGRPAVHSTKNYICAEADHEHFAEALKWYKSGRYRSKRKAFLIMSDLYYSSVEIVNGDSTRMLLPQANRPTLDQFYTYARKHISKEENDRIKTSAMEVRNDKRLRNSDSFYGVYGPGDMIEIDACEMDVSLVSGDDKNETAGRPTVYAAIDVYTRMILGIYVAFDQNSLLGVTNLFLNFLDDKRELCAEYGIYLSAESADSLWPSNILPRRVRVDRGAEFVSAGFDRICKELNIEKHVVSGGTGSLKGVVEQLFHQLHSMQNAHLEGAGLITKRHASKHHKEATLNVDQFMTMLLNEVLAYNQKYNPNYPLDEEMIDQGIDPIPAVLWKHYVEKFGEPRPIIDPEMYTYSLMTPVTATLSNEGITNDGLYYLANDPILDEERYALGNTTADFEARIDERSVGALYYFRDDVLMRAKLDPYRKDNAEHGHLTRQKWLKYCDKKKKMDAKGEEHNQQVEVNIARANQSIVDDAKKPTFSVDKNMRETRYEEKQRVSAANGIAGRLPDVMPGDFPILSETGDNAQNAIPALQDDAPVPQDAVPAGAEEADYTDFSEALKHYRENH